MIEERLTPCKQFLFLALSNISIQAESFKISIQKFNYIDICVNCLAYMPLLWIILFSTNIIGAVALDHFTFDQFFW